MFAVDTNILIYAHFERYEQHRKARAFCAQRLFCGEDWCLGWQVVYEYVRLTRHPAVHEVPLTLDRALQDLRPYLECRACHLLAHGPQHLQALDSVAALLPHGRGNFVHDCHYAALLKEHGVRRIYSADADFKKFDFLDVVDPTR